ncbi:MAG: hypothetical protein QOD72_3602 [Acidimicrobiaceae bacterium]|nr:hypothetical protein [Acidimicrobiaceae bacterium]
MDRVTRGFRLAGVSWRVVVADPAMLLVLFIGLVGMVVVSGGSFLLLFQRLPEAGDFRFPNYLMVLPVLWVGSIVSTYCNLVVTVMADHRLRGEDPTVADGMSVATSRLGRIVSWTLVSLAVGLVLQVIAERFKLAGTIASRLVGLAWGLATTFVVPVLALEDVGVKDAVRRSASIFKAKWGESVVAKGTIGLALMVAKIPALLVVGLAFLLSVPLGIIVAVLLLGSFVLISGALGAVVTTALYRYATDGVVLGAFTAEDLDAGYRAKKAW